MIKNHNIFLNKLYKCNQYFKNNDFKVLTEYKNLEHHIIIKNKYGYLKMRPSSLLRNSKPNIKSAIFKKEYFNNLLTSKNIFFQKHYYVIHKYINADNIIIKTIHGITKPISSSNLLRGSPISMLSATNKTLYAINEFNKKHNSLYTYNNFKYKNANNIIKAVCKIHGEFNTSYYRHKKGQQCAKCCSKRKELYNTKFINKANKIHKNKYDYSLVKYTNAKEKVIINCKNHGEFLQTPNNHLSGQGCPYCAIKYKVGGLRWWINIKGDKSIFYILHCYNDKESFIKVGITTKSVKYRYRKKKLMPYNYTIILEKNIKNRKLTFWLEKEILKKYKKYKYEPFILFAGKTECLNLKIKNIIKKELELKLEKHEKNNT